MQYKIHVSSVFFLFWQQQFSVRARRGSFEVVLLDLLTWPGEARGGGCALSEGSGAEESDTHSPHPPSPSHLSADGSATAHRAAAAHSQRSRSGLHGRATVYVCLRVPVCALVCPSVCLCVCVCVHMCVHETACVRGIVCSPAESLCLCSLCP